MAKSFLGKRESKVQGSVVRTVKKVLMVRAEWGIEKNRLRVGSHYLWLPVNSALSFHMCSAHGRWSPEKHHTRKHKWVALMDLCQCVSSLSCRDNRSKICRTDQSVGSSQVRIDAAVRGRLSLSSQKPLFCSLGSFNWLDEARLNFQGWSLSESQLRVDVSRVYKTPSEQHLHSLDWVTRWNHLAREHTLLSVTSSPTLHSILCRVHLLSRPLCTQHPTCLLPQW